MSYRRLIEEGLPLPVINSASAKEKSARRGHISGLHVWWARRPLAMSRAVVFGTLLPEPESAAEGKTVRDLLAQAAPFDSSLRHERIDPLRQLLFDSFGKKPRVLDCFAGGGAIPLEALRLGCDVTAMDLNPVAHLIERCVLEYPQRFGQSDEGGSNRLAEDFRKWSHSVGERVERRLASAFPRKPGSRPAVFYWARTMICPNPGCGREVPLITSGWLARSTRRRAWVRPTINNDRVDLELVNGDPPNGVDPSSGTVKASFMTCPACDTTAPANDVRAFGMEKGFGHVLYAVLEIGGGNRFYRQPHADDVLAAADLSSELVGGLAASDGLSPLPDEQIPKSQYRILRSLIYGIDSFRGLFNSRQLLVLGTLCEEVRNAHRQMLDEGMEADRARAVCTYLGLCVNRIADYNSTFTGAHRTLEAIKNTFSLQALRMVWDYTEIDPFAGGPGGWDGAVRWIEAAIRHCSSSSAQPATVLRGDAQSLPFEDDEFDAVIVDPPYYDAIQYSDLSDFFYVWLKRSVGFLYPELFATPLTPKSQEIIENRADKKSKDYIAPEDFEERLQRALQEMARAVKPGGIVTIIFAHTDVQAWERLLRALRGASLVVSTSWPMRSEAANRPTAKISAVLGSSVVLVCRQQAGMKEGFYDDVVRALENRIADRLGAFEVMGLVGADYFVSAVGPAFEVFAQYSRITKLSGEEVDVSDLMVLARQAVARHAMRRLLGEDKLAALDDPSLFYLTWRWAYLTVAIPADEAYKLERAFNIDLGALSRPGGFVKQSGSNFSALGPDERKDIKLSVSPSLIDVLHLACRLWDAGRRKELEQLLGATSMGTEPGFWAVARALVEILPDGNKERTMLLGLSGNRDALSAAAAKSTANMEELKLFT